MDWVTLTQPGVWGCGSDPDDYDDDTMTGGHSGARTEWRRSEGGLGRRWQLGSNVAAAAEL